MSGSSWFSSTMTRFIRLGRKYGEPTGGWEMCAMVTTGPSYLRLPPAPGASVTIRAVNVLDLVIVLLLVLSALNGYRRGAALQLTAYAGLLLGLIAGALLAPVVAGFVESPLAQAAVALTVLLVMAGIGDRGGRLIGARVCGVAR